MSQYLLDTNIVAFMLRGRRDVLDRLLEVGFENCHISEVTYAELLYGVRCSQHPEENRKALEAFVTGVDILPVREALENFAEIKYHLRKLGKMVEDSDIFIGATAIVYGMVMVTENLKHFANMPGIKLENWVRRGS